MTGAEGYGLARRGVAPYAAMNGVSVPFAKGFPLRASLPLAACRLGGRVQSEAVERSETDEVEPVNASPPKFGEIQFFFFVGTIFS